MNSVVRFSIVLIFSLVITSQHFLLKAQISNQGADSIPEVTKEQLENNLVLLDAVRRQFPGISLNKLCTLKYFNGDNPLFANPAFDDNNWKKLVNTRVNNFELDKIYWCRAKFRVQSDLKNQPLALYVYWQGAMEVYLNGRLIYSFGAFNNSQAGQIVHDAFYFPLRKVTLDFNDSADIKLLAFRFGNHSNLMGLIGSDVLNSPPSVAFTLHRQSTGESIDVARLNNTLYYGFFMGTNCIIILLTMFQVKRKKENFIQFYFGLFTFFTALVALTNFIDKGALELACNGVIGICALNSIGYSFSTYFLLLVMRLLFDKENKITPWIYAALLFAMLISYYTQTFSGKDFSTLIFILHLISFAELMRLSWLSVRNRAYGSWIIVTGALTFIVGGPILEQFYNAIHMGMSRPFVATMIIRITFYLSMPVSLSVFLAVQNLRNNRLLARQRDELDLEVQERTQQLRMEKQKSDDLLLNILPSEVAEELKEKGSADAKQFNDVTVMFTDFKNFTQISEKLSPAELVAEIHTCFKAFDNIIGKHNIEKIKTIGDAYMCAGGLPVANKTNAEDVVKAALEIQQFMQQHLEQRKNENKERFEIRIGVHTGPVVAGIVGVKKFAYDIWGDTVNIASRMESSGEAGKVNISGSTYELVKEKFSCTHRGKIQAKNKGEIDMYFVEQS